MHAHRCVSPYFVSRHIFLWSRLPRLDSSQWRWAPRETGAVFGEIRTSSKRFRLLCFLYKKKRFLLENEPHSLNDDNPSPSTVGCSAKPTSGTLQLGVHDTATVLFSCGFHCSTPTACNLPASACMCILQCAALQILLAFSSRAASSSSACTIRPRRTYLGGHALRQA